MDRKRILALTLIAVLFCCACFIPAHAAFGDTNHSPSTVDPAVLQPGIDPPFLYGDSFDNPIILSDGSTHSVTITSVQTYRYLKFVPSTSGIYTIESYNSTCDPAVWLYDGEYNQIGYSDNIGNDVNFRMHCILQQGETYFFVVDAPSQISGTYHIRFLSTASVSCLSALDALPDTSYSVGINTAYQTKYYTFIPEVSTEYLFYSSNANGDPELSIYDENFNLVACDSTDMGLNYNFRITANLTAGETYYLATHAYPGETASYDFCILMVPTTINDVFMIRNQGSNQYIDIEGPVQQDMVQQWSYHKDSHARWRIVKQDDGYYTIQALYGNQYYVGIDSIAIGANIKLYSSISDRTRWKLYVKSSGEIFFEPKTAPGRSLSAINSTIGSNLTLKWMTDSLNGLNIWKLESQSDTPLEGQRQLVWCWVATARMLANHYTDVSILRQQRDAVITVFGLDPNYVNESEITSKAGNYHEALLAACYFRFGFISQNSNPELAEYPDARYSQENLIKFLNDGHVVLLGRQEYLGNDSWLMGHAYVIVGYTTQFINGTIQYLFYIYDPFPEPEPSTWDSDTATTGQEHIWTYDQISNGNAGIIKVDERRWRWTVVASTDYSEDTLIPDKSPPDPSEE